jgi:hypothetical protein
MLADLNPSDRVIIEYSSEFMSHMILSINSKFFLKLHQPVSFIIETKYVFLTLGIEFQKISQKKSELQKFNNFQQCYQYEVLRTGNQYS